MDINNLELAAGIYDRISEAREALGRIKLSEFISIDVSSLHFDRTRIPNEITGELRTIIIEKLENYIVRLIDEVKGL